MARLLIAAGAVLIVVGLIALYVPALRPGRLPGDVAFGGSNWRVYAPFGTMILLSVILTLVLSLMNRRP